MPNGIEIYDNFLPREQFEFISFNIPNHLPWDYSDGVNLISNENTDKYNWQMVHLFYHHPHMISDHFNIIQPLLDKINPMVIQRIKANLNPATNDTIEYGYHRDIEPSNVAEKFTTAIFYVNNNNGYTVFEDGTKVESVANRLVTFPAEMKHSGTSCTDEKHRLVINFNYLKVEEYA